MEGKPCFRIGHMKIIDHLILGVADHYLKNNLSSLSSSHLETASMNTWNQVRGALSAGEINAAFLPVPIAMDLFSKDLDIKILMFVHRSGSMILKSNMAGIKSLSDFQGKTVLVPSELSIQNMLIHRLLSSAGLILGRHDNSLSHVYMEEAPPYLMSEMISLDKDRDIAGFSVAQPFASISVEKGLSKNLCPTSSLWKDHPCCVFVLKNSIIQDHPESVQELIALFLKIAQDIENREDDTTLEIASSFIQEKPELIRKMLFQTQISFAPDLLVPDIKILGMIQNYMTDTMNILKNKIDLSDIIDSRFTENIILETTIED